MLSNSQPKVLFIWTRPNPGIDNSGRDRVIRAMRQTLASDIQSHDYSICHQLSEARRLRKFLAIAKTILCALINGEPIQVALFDSKSEKQRLITFIRQHEPDVIYLDTVRTTPFLGEIRARFPFLRLVVDFDDLLSRRYRAQAEYAQNTGIRFGYLEKALGSTFCRWLKRLPLLRWAMRRETRTLLRVEANALRICDLAVFLSTRERELACSQHNVPLEKTVAIPPSFEVIRSNADLQPPYRFAFVGSDSLLQNALVIDYLLKIWKKLIPSSQLVIFGHQTRASPAIHNITYAGFEASTDKIYDKHTFALAPAILPGGIKMKVLEALSFSRPLVTNNLALEGLPAEVSDTGLGLTNEQILAVIRNPSAHALKLTETSRKARDILSDSWGPSSVRHKWLAALLETGADSNAAATKPSSTRVRLS